MCNWPDLSRNEIEYYLLKNRFNKITKFLLVILFSEVRIMQVKNITEHVNLNEYIVDFCDCRFNQMNCKNRIDTCFKQSKKGRDQDLINKIQNLNSENLVRIYVNNGGIKNEICHCCNCCCIPIIIHNILPEPIIGGSGYFPQINLHFCTNCGVCASICPFFAISDDLTIDKEKCLGCGLCWKNCSSNAIQMVKENRNRLKKPNKFLSFLFYTFFWSYILILRKAYAKKVHVNTLETS